MSDREYQPGEIQAFPAFPDPEPDPRDAEIDRLRKEMDGLYRTQASMQADCEAQEAEIESLRQTMAEMQDDLDAAYRLLGLAPYPLTA